MPSMPSFGGSSSSSQTASAPASAPQQAPQAEQSTRTAAAAPTTGWGAEVADESSSQGSTVSRWFGSITGGSTAASSSVPGPAPSTTTTAPRTAPTTTTRTAAAPPPSAESWAANTSAQREGEGGTAVGRWFSRQTSSAPAAAPAQPAAAPRGAGYTVQLANSSSRSDAQALWKKAKAANPQVASANPRIEQVDIGDFGTFYTVKIGPYATSSEGTKVCNALKRRGTDCSVVAPDGP